jgi:hypothetical protein
MKAPISRFARRFALFLAVGLLMGRATLPAVPPESIIMFKAVGWEQSTAAGAFMPGPSGVFIDVLFSANITGSSASLRGASGTVTLPRDTSFSFSGAFEYSASSVLDNAFPDGSYSLNITGSHPGTYPFNFNPPTAPPPVRISNFDALQVFTTTSVPVTWDSIPDVLASDLLFVSVEDEAGREVYSSPGLGAPGALKGAVRQVTVTGLQPGKRYFGYLTYVRISGPLSEYPFILTGRGVATRFALGSGPPPTTDTKRPRVIAYSPTDLSVHPAGWAGPVTLTFDEPMRPLTDPAAILNLGKNFTMSWSNDARTVTLDFTAPLPPNRYLVNLAFGPFGLTDVAGNSPDITFPIFTFTVEPLAPIVTRQPLAQTVVAGDPVVFDILATGHDSFRHAWSTTGAAPTVTTSRQLRLQRVTPANSGDYSVLVANDFGSVRSAVARLTVLPAGSAHSRLVNLSTRTTSGTGDQILLVGVTLGPGRTAQPMLLRAAGPALTAFGVAGALADPLLSLFRSGATVASDSNDNWDTVVGASAVAARLGAFAFLPASRDAALATTLAPGGYTVQVAGQSATGGIALAEIYDAAPLPDDSAPRLTNLSARATVGTGADALIAGFVIAGPTSKTLLLRAVGPTLGAFGLADTLAYPVLEIRDATGRLVATNDNWENQTAVMANTFAAVGAFALPPGSGDAALLVSLPPATTPRRSPVPTTPPALPWSKSTSCPDAAFPLTRAKISGLQTSRLSASASRVTRASSFFRSPSAHFP